MAERMTYIPTFQLAGHDGDCAANYFEPCDCVQGIVAAIELAFAIELGRLEKEQTDG